MAGVVVVPAEAGVVVGVAVRLRPLAVAVRVVAAMLAVAMLVPPALATAAVAAVADWYRSSNGKLAKRRANFRPQDPPGDLFLSGGIFLTLNFDRVSTGPATPRARPCNEGGPCRSPGIEILERAQAAKPRQNRIPRA